MANTSPKNPEMSPYIELSRTYFEYNKVLHPGRFHKNSYLEMAEEELQKKHQMLHVYLASQLRHLRYIIQRDVYIQFRLDIFSNAWAFFLPLVPPPNSWAEEPSLPLPLFPQEPPGFISYSCWVKVHHYLLNKRTSPKWHRISVNLRTNLPRTGPMTILQPTQSSTVIWLMWSNKNIVVFC